MHPAPPSVLCSCWPATCARQHSMHSMFLSMLRQPIAWACSTAGMAEQQQARPCVEFALRQQSACLCKPHHTIHQSWPAACITHAHQPQRRNTEVVWTSMTHCTCQLHAPRSTTGSGCPSPPLPNTVGCLAVCPPPLPVSAPPQLQHSMPYPLTCRPPRSV